MPFFLSSTNIEGNVETLVYFHDANLVINVPTTLIAGQANKHILIYGLILAPYSSGGGYLELYGTTAGQFARLPVTNYVMVYLNLALRPLKLAVNTDLEAKSILTTFTGRLSVLYGIVDE